MPIRQLVDIIQTHREIVVCDSVASMNAHQSLYHLTDGAYITLPDRLDQFKSLSGLICECSDNSLCVEFHMHVVLQWVSLLQVAAWKETLTWSDIFFPFKGCRRVFIGNAALPRQQSRDLFSPGFTMGKGWTSCADSASAPRESSTKSSHSTISAFSATL